jgi:hypothetical protein
VLRPIFFGFGVSPLLNDCLERVPLGFHSNVAIALKHLLRDVAGDVHDGLVADAALSGSKPSNPLG